MVAFDRAIVELEGVAEIVSPGFYDGPELVTPDQLPVLRQLLEGAAISFCHLLQGRFFVVRSVREVLLG